MDLSQRAWSIAADALRSTSVNLTSGGIFSLESVVLVFGPWTPVHPRNRFKSRKQESRRLSAAVSGLTGATHLITVHKAQVPDHWCTGGAQVISVVVS